MSFDIDNDKNIVYFLKPVSVNRGQKLYFFILAPVNIISYERQIDCLLRMVNVNTNCMNTTSLRFHVYGTFL